MFPGLAPVGGAEHAALLADDEQPGILDRSDGVEVELVGVVDALADVFPVLAAVGGFQQGSVGAHGKAGAGVLEPEVEQWRFALEVFELAGPGGAAVRAGEDLCIVTDGPAVLVIDEIDRGEHLPGRDPGLGPVVALVVGEKDMPAIADGHQPLAGMHHVEQQALDGLGRFEGVDSVGSAGRCRVCAGRQCRQSRQRKRRHQQCRTAPCRRTARTRRPHRLIHRPFSPLLLSGHPTYQGAF